MAFLSRKQSQSKSSSSGKGITSAAGKASLAANHASWEAQMAAKKPGDNRSTKGTGQLQAEALGAPKGSTVAGGYLLSENTKPGTQLSKYDVPGIDAEPAPGTPAPVDVSQPSPQTVQAGAGLPGAPTQPLSPNIPFADAIKGIDPNDRAGLGQIASKYQQAHAQMQGQPISQDAGEGKMLAQQTLKQFDQQQPVSPLGGIM